MDYELSPTGAGPDTGGREVTLVSGAETGGAFALCMVTLPPYGAGPPQRAEPPLSVGYYVVRGMLAATQGDRTVTLGPGSSLLVPPGAPSAFWNPAAAPAVALLIYTPTPGAPGRELDAWGAGRP